MEERIGHAVAPVFLERTTRTTLELQLTDNLLMLAKDFKGQPDKAAEFFDQSLIEDPTKSQDDEPKAA